MPKLSDADISNGLARLPGWSREGDEITKQFELPTFMDAIRFVERVAVRAEAADHHPDLDIRYRKVRVVLTTHSEGGISDKDLALADEIERAASG